ncbi:MAG: formyltransferase family protein [Candidatus Cloacimonadota bacterium]
MAGTTPQTYRIAVLTSGMSRGSNLRAIHRYFRDHQIPVKISFVLITRKSAPVADFCRSEGLAVEFASSLDQAAFEARIQDLVKSYKPHLLVLAGFMKKLSAACLDTMSIPALNIHPALLPKYGGQGFYGSRVHEAVFAAGEEVSGVSIHLVDPEYDHGRIISQAEVDISDCQSAAEIGQKVLELEHRFYAPTIYSFLCSR